MALSPRYPAWWHFIKHPSVIAYAVPRIFSATSATAVTDLSHAFLRVTRDEDSIAAYCSGPVAYNGGARYALPLSAADKRIPMLGNDDPEGVKGMSYVTADVVANLQIHSMKSHLAAIAENELTLKGCLQ